MKQKIMIGVIIVFGGIVIASKHRANTQAEQEALEAQQEAEMEAEMEEEYEEDEEESGLSEAELEYQEEQAYLAEKYGAPAEGFRWDDDGELIPLSDSNMSAEDVLYAYIRGVSQLSFADVQKYSFKSSVVKQYDRYYNKETDLDYETEFSRRIYKDMLLSLENEGATDTAVFADKKYIITVNLKCIDLADKSFWEDDADTIFQTLYTYKRMEDDGTKANQYLYDYVQDYYESGKAKTVTKSIDFTLEKGEQGGWLVTDDSALDMLCQYKDGQLVADYIKNCYEDWYNETMY